MSQQLDELRAELGKVFGRTTKWQALCKQHKVAKEAEWIKLAEQVLAEHCTGTVAEAHSHRLELQGVKSMDINDFLGGKAIGSPTKPGKRP